jgi:hypothetical protein
MIVYEALSNIAYVIVDSSVVFKQLHSAEINMHSCRIQGRN